MKMEDLDSWPLSDLAEEIISQNSARDFREDTLQEYVDSDRAAERSRDTEGQISVTPVHHIQSAPTIGSEGDESNVQESFCN